MAWRLTDSLDTFLAAADDLLRADPVLHTVPLTVLDTLRQAGPAAFGDNPPVFGWHESAHGAIDGALLQTPPFPLLIASLPPGSAESLIEALAAARQPPIAVNLPSEAEPRVLAAWAARTGGLGTGRMRSRLFRLDVLAPPDPMPPGAARVAGDGDRELLVDWTVAFVRETGAGRAERAARAVDDRLGHHGVMLWETGGEPVAMAALTREIAGVVRVMSVYTPPAHRRRGYGGAVTTAVSQAALAAGAAAVVLFTDLANPTSNALYQRLGYRPIGDRVELDLTAGEGTRANVTGATGASSEKS
ncbi:MAG TPA: GNAT family N-acetyltransferase [Streptosporangiaceae bacterium]|nr:GNAT family N-acetyltransferase [Streptosporangiaceae bacterium]